MDTKSVRRARIVGELENVVRARDLGMSVLRLSKKRFGRDCFSSAGGGTSAGGSNVRGQQDALRIMRRGKMCSPIIIMHDPTCSVTRLRATRVLASPTSPQS